MSDDRVQAMQQDGMLVGIAGLSLLPGMNISPYFEPAFILVKFLLAPSFFITSPLLLLYFTSLFISVVCLVIAGVPAALYERSTGLQTSNAMSLGIWLGGLLLLCAPVLISFG